MQRLFKNNLKKYFSGFFFSIVQVYDNKSQLLLRGKIYINTYFNLFVDFTTTATTLHLHFVTVTGRRK